MENSNNSNLQKCQSAIYLGKWFIINFDKDNNVYLVSIYDSPKMNRHFMSWESSTEKEGFASALKYMAR